MKQITCFYLETCPYCRQAKRAIEELAKENPKYNEIVIVWVEESEHPDIADKYDYYYTPTMFLDQEKVYEAHPGESYEECKASVKKVFDLALA